MVVFLMILESFVQETRDARGGLRRQVAWLTSQQVRGSNILWRLLVLRRSRVARIRGHLPAIRSFRASASCRIAIYRTSALVTLDPSRA